MICPHCGGKTWVIRTNRWPEVIDRTRRCEACRVKFHTEEKACEE